MSATATTTLCSHCGERCEPDEEFCCQGCETVYELLQSSGMGGYYELESTPGVSQKRHSQEDLSYLNDESVIRRLVEFQDNRQTHITFQVPSIHCSSCIWLLEHLPRLNAGIMSSRVDFPNRTVAVRFNHAEVSLADVVRLLRKIGYEPTLSLASEGVGKREQTLPQRRQWMKLGLAAFAFGNVMLFSLPEYFAPELLDDTLRSVFTTLNILLSLPVLLYSASDYITGAWQSLKQRYVTLDVPIALGIIALYAQSVWDVTSGHGPGYFDSFTGLIFFLLTGKAVQSHTYNALSFNRTYEAYFPLAVHRLEQDRLVSGAVAHLKPGDHLFIRNMELVPCDSLLESETCEVDFSFVTGESTPVRKMKGDVIYAGGRIIGTAASLIVTRATSQSYLTRLWNRDSVSEDGSRSVMGIADRISPYFTSVVMVIAAVSTTIWFTIDPAKAPMVLASVLIIACPCALAMAAPFTLSAVRRHLGRHFFYTKNTLVVEQLSRIRTVLFDKTGTLTDASATVRFSGEPLSELEKERIHAVLRNTTHPLGQRFDAWLNVQTRLQADTYLEEKGNGIRAWVEGRDILMGSFSWLSHCGVIGMPAQAPSSSSVIYLAFDGHYRGVAEIRHSVRNGLSPMLQKMRYDGYEMHVVSGDSSREEQAMMAGLPDIASVRFDQSPEDKLTIVQNMKMHTKVAMIGDGLNDGAALRAAHAGIAVTDDIHAFTPASDAILKGNELTKLPAFLGFTKRAMFVIYAAYGLSFAYNVVGLSFAVQGLLTPIISAILMPVSSITIIAFTTGATWLTAKSKGL